MFVYTIIIVSFIFHLYVLTSEFEQDNIEATDQNKESLDYNPVDVDQKKSSSNTNNNDYFKNYDHSFNYNESSGDDYNDCTDSTPQHTPPTDKVWYSDLSDEDRRRVEIQLKNLDAFMANQKVEQVYSGQTDVDFEKVARLLSGDDISDVSYVESEMS